VLVGPTERERGQHEQAPAGKRCGLGVIENDAGVVECEIGEARESPDMAVATFMGACPPALHRQIRISRPPPRPNAGDKPLGKGCFDRGRPNWYDNIGGTILKID